MVGGKRRGYIKFCLCSIHVLELVVGYLEPFHLLENKKVSSLIDKKLAYFGF